MPPENAAIDEPEITIDEQIAQDWKAIQEKHKPEPEAVEAVETVETESEAPVAGKPRDEAGKFVKAEAPAKEAKPVEKAELPETAQPVSADKATSQELHSAEQPQRDLTRAPSTWKPQARLDWEKLSPAHRAEIHRREADFQNGQAQLLPDARLGNSIRAVTEPYRAIIAQSYGSDDRMLQSMLPTLQTFAMGNPQQKLAEIVRISQQFGIDLSQLSGQGEPQTQQQFADPRVDQLLQNMQNQERQRQSNEQRSLETMATAWMNEVDAQGQPKREYLQDVMQEMSVLIPQIKQTNPLLTHPQVLEQAYDRAVWANPNTRQALQGKQQSELLERQRAANQTRVQDAKRAASTNVTRRASTPSPVKPGDMVDTITNTARELGLIS